MSAREDPVDSDRCPCGKTTRSTPRHRGGNGNCMVRLAPDSLPFQCVGPWSRDKHDYLERYITATQSARTKFVFNSSGGAAFVDLFAGPGLACVPGQMQLVQGSPLIALGHDVAPFSDLILCDRDPENVRALVQRTTGASSRVHVIAGDCNECIDQIVSLIPPFGLNIAMVDPFGLRPLRWETLSRLGSVKRMDLIIHFPTGTIKRNFGKPTFRRRIDLLIGSSQWQSGITSAEQVPQLIDWLRRSLVSIGYTQANVRSLAVENTKDNVLYHLMYASKHPLGDQIWQSVTATSPRGERELPWR